jgi:hypothetical protein
MEQGFLLRVGPAYGVQQQGDFSEPFLVAIVRCHGHKPVGTQLGKV